MKKIILIITFFILTQFVYSQNSVNNSIIIKTDSGYAEVKLFRGKIKHTDLDKVYYWYFKDAIHFSIGGVFQHPLNDEYYFYNYKNNILEYGHFKKGLKIGIWKKWYSDGKIKEVTGWKNGLQQGKQEFYDCNGNVEKIVLFKKGKFKKIIFPENKPPLKAKKVKKTKVSDNAPKLPNKESNKPNEQIQTNKKNVFQRIKEKFSKKKDKNETLK